MANWLINADLNTPCKVQYSVDGIIWNETDGIFYATSPIEIVQLISTNSYLRLVAQCNENVISNPFFYQTDASILLIEEVDSTCVDLGVSDKKRKIFIQGQENEIVNLKLIFSFADDTILIDQHQGVEWAYTTDTNPIVTIVNQFPVLTNNIIPLQLDATGNGWIEVQMCGSCNNPPSTVNSGSDIAIGYLQVLNSANQIVSVVDFNIAFSC